MVGGPAGSAALPEPALTRSVQAGLPAGAEGRPDRLRAKERAENFPVALRLLPRRYRTDLVAVYDVVRVIDDLGDEATGDRSAQLRAFAGDLARIWAGQLPDDPVLRRLAGTVHRHRLPRQPFDRLIAANLQDQTVSSYQSFQELLDYCALSAAPIGELVLRIFHAHTPDRQARSDAACTALQLLEHWQDIGEDNRAGRTYLPRQDLDRFGVQPGELTGSLTSAALRRLVLFETDRAVALLEASRTLPGELTGAARLAVAGYLAGGLATVDAIRRARADVLGTEIRPRKLDVLRHLVRLWRRR